jgi:hypothetical protein
MRSVLLPYKANAKLIIDADTVLASPLSFERFQHISRRLAEIVETCGCIHPVEFPPSYALDSSPPPVRA